MVHHALEAVFHTYTSQTKYIRRNGIGEVVSASTAAHEVRKGSLVASWPVTMLDTLPRVLTADRLNSLLNDIPTVYK